MKLSVLINKARIKPKAKSKLAMTTTCFNDIAPEGMGRFGLITASLSLSKKSFSEKPAEVISAIEKKIKRIVNDERSSLVIANAVKSDKPPVMSQYGSRRSATNPLAGVVDMLHFPLFD